MPLAALVHSADALTRRFACLASPFALLIRLHVGWVFVKSGYQKAANWESTLFLFQEEYRVPLLSPWLAAVAGTASELLFGALVMVGLFGRASALGLFAVNALAVFAYAHVLLSQGFEAAIAQHVLWGFMLLVLAVYGPGALSLDRLVARREGNPAPARL